jgi:glycosyltransferase involved in cell wall biosynthesis
MALPKCGIHPAFACLKPDRFPELRRSQETPLHEIPMSFRADLWPAMRLARLVWRERYDVLHTHSARALLIARIAAALTGTPIVHHVHGHTSAEVAGRRFTRLNAWVERMSLPAAQAVIAVSQSVADYLRNRGAEPKRLHVVCNGVPGRTQLPDKPKEPTVWNIGLVALLRPRKGLETFLDAVALVCRRTMSLRLHIVGRFETSQYEQEIRARAYELGLASKIEWREFQPRIDAELDAMDMLVFPSVLPEGMPMVLLEAMAAGLPIVASGVPGVTDVLRDCHDGLLVPPGDPQSLADAITKLMNDPELRERLRTGAFHRQQEQFSDRKMAAAVADIYRLVDAEHRAES